MFSAGDVHFQDLGLRRQRDRRHHVFCEKLARDNDNATVLSQAGRELCGLVWRNELVYPLAGVCLVAKKGLWARLRRGWSCLVGREFPFLMPPNFFVFLFR